jgi:hypothetical protein
MSRDRFGAGTEPPSEVAPGVHRIEGRMGDNRLCLYALRGERTLLVDSGLRTTPAAYILPHPDKSGLPERGWISYLSPTRTQTTTAAAPPFGKAPRESRSSATNWTRSASSRREPT